jgi:putative chitinase
MNIANKLTFGSNLAPAIYGSLFGRNQEDMKYFTAGKSAKAKADIGKSPGKLQQEGNDMAVQVLGLIYRLMQRNEEDKKLDQEEAKNKLEEQESEEERRNKQIVEAIKGRKAKKPTKKTTKPFGEKKETAPTKEKPTAAPKEKPAAPPKPTVEKPTAAPKVTTTKPPTAPKAPTVSTAEKMATGTAIATAAAGAGIVAASLAAAGLSSKAQANVLAQVEAESNFKPKSENLNYSSAQRIQDVFGRNRIPDLNMAQKLVNNPEALANHVYAKTDGNSEPGDGWKYRGRGFLQHTGKNQYISIAKYTGIDVVNNPDLLNDPKVAAKAVPWFFLSYKRKSPQQLENISEVNRAVGFAGGQKEADHRASLVSKYENGGGIGSQIDSSSKENKNLKDSLDKSNTNQITTTNTYAETQSKETKKLTEVSDDTNTYLKKKKG